MKSLFNLIDLLVCHYDNLNLLDFVLEFVCMRNVLRRRENMIPIDRMLNKVMIE